MIIIIGVGVYVFLGSKGASQQAGNETSTSQSNSGSSLSSLVAAGQPVTCTFATTTATGSTNGTMYIANGMVAGDFTTVDSKAGSINSHMIVRDSTNYMWTSMSTQGFKSTVTPGQPASGQTQGVYYNAQVDYSCQPWTADAAKFNLPANISFVSTASFVPPQQGAGATGAGGSASPGSNAQCAACNQLTGAQKAQCLAALQC